jgi:hypothetical protein
VHSGDGGRSGRGLLRGGSGAEFGIEGLGGPEIVPGESEDVEGWGGGVRGES